MGPEKARSPHLRQVVIGVVAVLGVTLICLSASASARFVWNVTASAPKGIYLIDGTIWNVGDRVAVRPSASLAAVLDRMGILSRGKLLIKRVVAGEGDTVCRDALNIAVNGSVIAVAKSTTSDGILLPSWQGCRLLTTEDAFVLGDKENSFDGRYFGVIGRNEIVGRVSLLLPFP